MAEVTKPIVLDETAQAIKNELALIRQKMDGVVAEPLSVTENGIYTPEQGKAYAPVTVNVEAGGWQRPIEWPNLDAIYEGMGSPRDTLLYTLDSSVVDSTQIDMAVSSGGAMMAEAWDYSDSRNPIQITNRTSSGNLTGLKGHGYVVIIIKATSGTLTQAIIRDNGTPILEAIGHGTMNTPLDALGYWGWQAPFFYRYMKRDAREFDILKEFPDFGSAYTLEEFDMANIGVIESTYGTQTSFSNAYALPMLDLSSIDISDWTSATDLRNYLNKFYRLHTLNLSGWDMSSWTPNMSQGGQDLYSLRNIIPPTYFFKASFSLSSAVLLTHESLVGVIGALPQLASGESYTLTLGSTNLNKLTDAEKAVATDKGWTVA